MQKSLAKLFVAAMAVASFLTSTSSVSAQVITTSTLEGTVLNDQNQAVPNASITVVHEPTSSTYTTMSRADGSYVLHGLRPGGPYTVSARAPGFAPSDVREVNLDIATGASVNVHLKSEVVQLEAFSVSASPIEGMFDPNQTGTGSYLKNKDIRDLPAGDRSINSLARLDPRITYNRDPQDRAISVAGINNRYNSIQVDGVSASDPFGLNGNNTAAERNVIPLDSLEALSINTSPYYSRNAGFVGAQINAITKSGTNEFKGSLYYTYRGRTVNGWQTVAQTLDNLARPISNFSEQTIGGTLGGPIIPKKLFFYVSYEKVDEDRIPPVPTAAVPKATVDQITAAATALGFKPGSPTPPSGNKLTDDNVLAKVDWQISDRHRASVRYNKVKSSRPTFPGFGSAGGVSENNFSYDSDWYMQNTSNTTYFAQLVSRWNDKLNTELSLSRSKYHSEPQNNSRQPYVQIRNVTVPGSSNTSYISFGTEYSRHANILDVQTDTAEAFASYDLNDKHTLQGGLQYDTSDIYNLYVQYAYGYYDFNSLDQFLAVAAKNNGTINYRTYQYNQLLAGVDPAATFNEQNAGLFLNDSWRVTPNLKVDAGLRVDMPVLPDAIPYNQTFANTFGMSNTASYDGKKILQPRIGFNWQPKWDDKHTIIRGGIGLFYGRAPRVWISNSYSNTGMNYKTWSAGTNPVAGSASQAPVVSANPDSQSTVGSSPAMQVAFMDPGFQLPSRWKANLAFERELGAGLKLIAELEESKVNRDIFYSNINIQNTGAGPDGRILYFSKYGTSSSGTQLVSTLFTNRIIELGNTSQGESRTFVLSVERPRKKDGWYWKASYVRTHASEVLYGTSSVAASNWNNRSIFNTNAQELARASLEIKDRILINVTKDFELLKGYKTTASLLYDGHTGFPFSLNYSNDANGDSVTGNDLIYVPLRENDPKVRFATTADRDNFFKIVDRFHLTPGGAVSANSQTYPWVNQFDLSLKQEIKLPAWRHKVILGADFLNVGNLLNSRWGLIRGSNQFFKKNEAVASSTYDSVAKQYVYSSVSTALANGTYTTTVDGKPVVSNGFAPSLGRGEPGATRWSILFSARYEF